LDTEISPKPRPRLGIDIRGRLEVSPPVGRQVRQPATVEVPLKAQAGEGRTAEAGSDTGRQATGAVSGRSWCSFCGASRRRKPGGGGKSRRSPSSRCGNRARLVIRQRRKLKMESRQSEEAASAASSRWSDQWKAETHQRPRSKTKFPREIERTIGSVAGGREVQMAAEDSSPGLAG